MQSGFTDLRTSTSTCRVCDEYQRNARKMNGNEPQKSGWTNLIPEEPRYRPKAESVIAAETCHPCARYASPVSTGLDQLTVLETLLRCCRFLSLTPDEINDL